MSFFQKLKDTRRRVVETVLQKTGMAEETTDPALDELFRKFVEMVDDMNECGAALSSTLVNQKKMFSDSYELSKSLAHTYQKHLQDENWRDLPSNLQQAELALKFYNEWIDLHEVFRSSSAQVCADMAFTPTKNFVVEVGDGVGDLDKDRKTKLIDFDAHKRRHKKLESKAHSSAGLTPSEEADLNKFSSKCEVAQQAVDEVSKTEQDLIVRAAAEWDAIIDEVLVVMLVTQADLYSRVAERLNRLVAIAPKDLVDRIKTCINRNIECGGVMVEEKKTRIGVALEVLAGKALVKDAIPVLAEPLPSAPSYDPPVTISAPITNPNNLPMHLLRTIPAGDLDERPLRNSAAIYIAPAPPAAPSCAPPPPPTLQTIHVVSEKSLDDSSPFSRVIQEPQGRFTGKEVTNPFTEDDPAIPSTVAAATKTVIPPHIPPKTRSVRASLKFPRVVALYDCQPEDDEELQFFSGDVIEVLAPDDEGWTKGLLRGVVGLFPTSYCRNLDE